MAGDDSDFSDDSSNGPNEENEKMQQLLAEWDEKDDQDDVFDDSEEEDDDDDAAAQKKKAALKKKRYDSEDEEVSDEEEEEEAAAVSDVEGSEDDDDVEYEVEEVSVEEDEEDEEEEEEDAEEEYEEEEEDVVEEIVEKPKKSKKSKSKSRSVEEDDDDITYMSADTADRGEPDAIVDELKKKPKKKKEKSKPKKVTEIEEDDDDDDKAMKALLANWDEENGNADDDDDDDDDDSDDDDSEVSEREVILDDNVIDHIVLAAPDLEEAMGEFEKKTGLAAVIAGTIKGLGIKCARVSFTDSTYLEIVAPDPKGPGPIGELIKSKGLKELTPFHFAIRTSKAEQLKDEVGQFGYTPDHITMFGAKSDGTPRKWEMLYLYGHGLGGTCPFFINWANSDHPCATLPVVGKLKKLTIRAPEDDPVHKLLDHVGVKDINVETGDKPKLAVSFSSPEGTVKFSTHKAVGFKFPGFEADVGTIPGDDGEQDAEVVFDDPKLPELLPVDGEEPAVDDYDEDDFSE